MSDFDCGGPGIGELMLAFDAALGPLAVGIELALDPNLAVNAEWAEENLEAALALMVPGAALPIAIIDFLEVSVSLPMMNIPTVPPTITPGFLPHPGWGALQMNALGLQTFNMIMVPIDIMIGVFNLEIDLSVPMIDIVTPLLPDIPGRPGLAKCISERLEPIFGTG